MPGFDTTKLLALLAAANRLPWSNSSRLAVNVLFEAVVVTSVTVFMTVAAGIRCPERTNALALSPSSASALSFATFVAPLTENGATPGLLPKAAAGLFPLFTTRNDGPPVVLDDKLVVLPALLAGPSTKVPPVAAYVTPDIDSTSARHATAIAGDGRCTLTDLMTVPSQLFLAIVPSLVLVAPARLAVTEFRCGEPG